MNSYNVYFQLISKYFKSQKTQLLVEVCLENYNNRNLYFRIDYFKKDSVYKLSYIDLDHIESNNIGMWINSCLMEPNTINYIENLFNNCKFEDIVVKDNQYLVYINTFFNKFIHIEFNRFLTASMNILTELFIIIFNNCPKKIEGFFFEIVALITNCENKFTYNDEIEFDLFNDNINKLFDDNIIDKGLKYYEDDQIKFLEKIDNQYIAMVEGADDYVLIIDYNDKSKILQLFCSCPNHTYCKHLYAVLLAIRNNNFKPFYKVVYEKKDSSLLQRIMDFKYYLCVGLDNEGLKLINRDGNVDVVPLRDMDNICNFKVIEDDDNMSLTKQINSITLNGIIKQD